METVLWCVVIHARSFHLVSENVFYRLQHIRWLSLHSVFRHETDKYFLNIFDVFTRSFWNFSKGRGGSSVLLLLLFLVLHDGKEERNPYISKDYRNIWPCFLQTWKQSYPKSWPSRMCGCNAEAREAVRNTWHENQMQTISGEGLNSGLISSEGQLIVGFCIRH